MSRISHNARIGHAMIASLALVIGFAAVIVSVSIIAHPALAQFGLDKTVDGIGKENLPSTYGGGADALPKLIGRIVSTALSLVGTLFLVLMLYGGFLWMTARGDTKHVQKAKDLITSAIIGLIIVASAYALTAFVLTRVEGSGNSSQSSDSDSGAGPATPAGVGPGEACSNDVDCASGTCNFPSGNCADDGSVCAIDDQCPGSTCILPPGGATCA